MGVKDNIYVTEPHLPPLEEFIPYLNEIWKNKRLTNNGPFHIMLEDALCEYLGIKYISLFTNGTIALVTALQALRITGEVITTPYSFVATSHSLLWNNIRPVFVDIDPETYNIDPKKIEKAITSKTTAILPVHCYGNPCDTVNIEEIANSYNLKVIYDAAHAFGVEDKGGSILRHGDLSILSFHATKVYNTFEGGAIISPDKKTKQHIDNLKNFGFLNETTVIASGINGKMSEINAAFGLLQLKYIDAAINKRKIIDKKYRNNLKEIKGIKSIDRSLQRKSNYAYYPILIDDEYKITRDQVYENLKNVGVYGRRYFYPIISEFTMYSELPSAKKENLKNAVNIADKVLCLPIYADMPLEKVEMICDKIREYSI